MTRLSWCAHTSLFSHRPRKPCGSIWSWLSWDSWQARNSSLFPQLRHTKGVDYIIDYLSFEAHAGSCCRDQRHAPAPRRRLTSGMSFSNRFLAVFRALSYLSQCTDLQSNRLKQALTIYANNTEPHPPCPSSAVFAPLRKRRRFLVLNTGLCTVPLD